MSLPNPQLMSDAQSLVVFSQAISQAAVQLVNAVNKATPEVAEFKSYFLQKLAKIERDN